MGSRSRSRSLRQRSGRSIEYVLSGGRNSRRLSHAEEDEEALRWAAIEKLPTYDRLRTSIFKSFAESGEIGSSQTQAILHKQVDVRRLDMDDRRMFMESTFKVAEEDNEKFLKKLRDRIDRVGINLPTVEVRFENLTVHADCQIGNRALPSLPNAIRDVVESALSLIGINLAKTAKFTILKDVSGIVKPSRMSLLLGPPSSGKTTLLLALAGSQNDVHVGEMTVKETLDFSARCQGVGTRYELLSELARREKQAGILPEAEVDLFMKATAMEGVESSMITDYTLKVTFPSGGFGATGFHP
ncbi:ABC transporter G family member 35, partial [Cucurbita argyrosperma subsp. sororia]